MLKCQYCAAEKGKNGQAFKSQGALNLHESRCKLEQAAAAAQPNEDECKHKMAVLDPNRPDHGRAMNAGFRKFCRTCGELA